MTTISLAAHRPVLAERIPASLVRDVSLVVGVAALTSAAAQISVPIHGSPAPLSGQTFAVLLAAAAVGPLRGMLGQVLYMMFGLVGLPVYAGGKHGYEVFTGATFGYFVGFVAASAVVGYLARAGLDRKVWGMALAFAVGSAVIYLPGALWLAHATGWSSAKAWHFGVEIFLIGDLIKAIAAGALLPAAWRLLR